MTHLSPLCRLTSLSRFPSLDGNKLFIYRPTSIDVIVRLVMFLRVGLEGFGEVPKFSWQIRRLA